MATMNTTVTETFEAILEKQIQACGQLNKILTNTKKKGESNFTISYLENRIKLYQETWEKIENLNGYLQAARKADHSKEELPYFQGETMDRTEDAYFDGMDYLRGQISRLSPPCTPPSANSTMALPTAPVSHTQVVKLPKIEIPTFDGDVAKWRAFEARFNSAVSRNQTLTDSVRLQYLLGALKGDALAAVEHLDLVDASFAIAWERLRELYDNDRVVVQSLLQRLYSLQTMKLGQLDTLKQYTVHFRNALEALHKLGKKSEDHHLVFLITGKFDRELTSEWNKLLGNSKQYPSYKELEDFLLAQATSAEATNQSHNTLVSDAKPSDRARPKSSTHVIEEANRSSPQCPVCSETHLVRDCAIFRKLRPLSRYDLLKDSRVCINCLRADHTSSHCPSTNVCRECQGKHHTMLHRGDGPSAGRPSARSNPRSVRKPTGHSTQPTVPLSTPTVHSAIEVDEDQYFSTETYDDVATCFAETAPPGGKTVLLATAIVKVYAPDGRSRLVRALLDQGSQSSFIATNLVQHLHLTKTRTPISVTGLGGEHASHIDYSTHIRIGAAGASAPVTSTRAHIVRHISRYVPPPIHLDKYAAFSNLKLADPTPASNQRIELLLGAELFSEIIRPGIRHSRPGELVAQNTAFGWILSGKLHATVPSHPTIAIHHGVTEDPLEKALSRFWETETIPESRPLTPKEIQCEQHFVDTYTRDTSGRFIVRLPFIKTIPDDFLGNSFRGAASSLKRLEQTFERNENVKLEYAAFIHEYESLGHMSRLAIIEKTRSYIPHRAVVREESLTTKLRVVFNASHKTSSGYSLNELLHQGPKLQQDITKILLRWRLHEYVFVADIEKMFRQILIHADDRKYQCILWNNVKTKELEAYELNTVTYGTTSAPYLSMRVIRELNNLEGANFPLATPVLDENIYVDDVFLGAPDKKLLDKTRIQVCELLARGGFNLRKWAGNDQDLLRKIPVSNHSHAVDLRIFHESNLKVLGIRWTPSDDAFSFELHRFVARDVPMTKRELLSEIATLYDPLGWLSPLIIRAKILMQQQWLEKIDWDDKVSDTTQATWNSFCVDWRAINAMRIPRWIRYGPDLHEMQLHGFSDASNAAYSCAIYARVSSISGDTYTTLLVAKSRVAPIKTQSIPVLELNGAVMLTDVMDHVIRSIQVAASRIVCWTDSTIVLAWLQKHPATWKTAVANRTSKIHTTLPTAIWKHVPTKSNPADLNSRGIKAPDLLASTFWIEGPSWLKETEQQWPPQQRFNTEEGRSKAAVHTTALLEEWDALLRISTWPRLIRVFGYVQRFLDRTRHKKKAAQSYLTVSELRAAETKILRSIQTRMFPAEITAIANSKSLNSRSPLLKLNPFLDKFGILRVGGRLRNSFLPWETKHPIVLPKHHVSELILRDAHLRTVHGGTQITVFTARQKYWIIGIRDSARRIIHRCVRCARWRAETATQIMQDLVPTRCRPSSPFANIGIDYAGPYQVRDAAGRGKRAHKAYIGVFICLATHAIHLELVHDYSTDAFLAAFDRFISRRGIPQTIVSDNGTNFVGAANELARDFVAIVGSPEVNTRCSELRVDWSFYPPGAPHHGGMQEAAVRSVKHHLRRIVGTFTPTAEEMFTLLCKIEATLNSRPLTRVRDDVDCLEILTPGHFLTGGPLNSRPVPAVIDEPITHLSRWQTLQKFHELLWITWSREYLQELQSRYKWSTKQKQIQEGDIVLLENPTLPPNKWEMGRIQKTFPGKDGNVRVVEVRTKTSVYRRPITRLCILPVN